MPRHFLIAGHSRHAACAHPALPCPRGPPSALLRDGALPQTALPPTPPHPPTHPRAALAVEVGEVTFRFPVEIGDLLRMRTLVLHTWVHPGRPGQGRAHVQVEASVTQPEKRQRCA